MLIQLQSRRIVRASDLAERFGISLRTVYRDMRTLEEAGVPIVSEAGIGYSLMQGYRLPPVMFSKEEAAALLISEKLIRELGDESTGDYHRSAMYKIRAVLQNTDKEYLEYLEDRVLVRKNPYLPELQYNNYFGLITEAIIGNRLMKMKYFSNHRYENTERVIEPVGIWFLSGRWHMTAWCRLREDYRHFRIDRIQTIESTQDVFEKKHPPLSQLIREVAKQEGVWKVRIRVKKDAYKYIGDQKYYMGFVSQEEIGDEIEMNFLSQGLEGLARWYLMIGDSARIMEPEDLKKLSKQLITRSLENI